jgi:hypothetical protein
MTRLAPDLVWMGGRFHTGLDGVIDPVSGRIVDVSHRGREVAARPR